MDQGQWNSMANIANVANVDSVPSVGPAKPFDELTRQDIAVLRATSRLAVQVLRVAWRRSRFYSVPVSTLALPWPLSWGIAGQAVRAPPGRTPVPEDGPLTERC